MQLRARSGISLGGQCSETIYRSIPDIDGLFVLADGLLRIVGGIGLVRRAPVSAQILEVRRDLASFVASCGLVL